MAHQDLTPSSLELTFPEADVQVKELSDANENKIPFGALSFGQEPVVQPTLCWLVFADLTQT